MQNQFNNTGFQQQQQQPAFPSTMSLNNNQNNPQQFQSQMGLQQAGIPQQNGFTPNIQQQYNTAPGFIQHQPQPLQSLPTLQQSQGLSLDSRFNGNSNNKNNESLPRSVSFNMDNNQYDEVVAEYEQQLNNAEQRRP